MTNHDYIIADLRIRSDRDLVALGLRGFAPFKSDSCGGADCYFSFDKDFRTYDNAAIKPISESYLAEADAHGALYKSTEGYLYRIASCNSEHHVIEFAIDTASNNITTNIKPENIDIAILRFGLWIMFGVVLAQHNGIAIHSSAIECDGRVVLFLGESGTGKSTHTRLWRENILGAHLLNDDSPIVRFVDGKAIIYGSPWSGKTPCYKNLSYPIAAFCRLSQAPDNNIKRLSTIAAIGAVLPSTPPQFAHDGALQDSICTTLGELLRCVPVYHLACLPNAEAAYLSHQTMISDAETTR